MNDIWAVPSSLVDKLIGDNAGDVVRALYEYGVREKPKDRDGNEYVPEWYPSRHRPDLRHDDQIADAEEYVALEIAVRRHICGLATATT